MSKKIKALPGTAVALAAALALDVAAIMPNPARAATDLKTLTNDDKTASVSVPDGWSYTRGGGGTISVTGPQNERVTLGSVAIGKNASPGVPSAGALFALPYGATLKDKLTADFNGYAAKTGAPDPDVTYSAQLPTKNPRCARFLGGLTTKDGPRKFEAIICGFAPDVLGFYKNVVFLASVPASSTTQERSIVEAVAASYRVTPAAFKFMLAPVTPPPAAAGAGMPAASGALAAQMIVNQTNAGVSGLLHSSDCMDLGVLRDSPPWEMARQGC